MHRVVCSGKEKGTAPKKDVSALMEKRNKIILISLFLITLAVLSAAVIIWPLQLTEAMSRIERITNRLPFAAIMAYGAGAYIAHHFTMKK